jgi:flagellin
MGGMQRSLRDAHAHDVKATERIATGKSVNSAKDNAAAFTVSSNLETYGQSRRMLARGLNTQLEIAELTDGALEEVNRQLKRAKEFAIQARSETLSDQERSYAQLEFDATLKEIDRLAQTTKYEDRHLLRFRGIDIGFVVDRSSSMDGPAANVRDSIAAFQQIFADGKLDAHMGVAHYYEKNHSSAGGADNNDGVELFQDIGSADVEPALQAIVTQRYGGFVDPYTGLVQASGSEDIGDIPGDDTFSWRDDTLKKVMILVTDTHNETNFHSPALSETSTAAKLAATGITVHTIANNNDPYNEITQATGGTQGALSNLGDPVGISNPLTGTGGIAEQLVADLRSQSGGGEQQVGIFGNEDNVASSPIPVDVTPANLGLEGSDIATVANAGDALEQLETAIDTVNGYRAGVGAYQNRLASVIDNNLNTIEVESAASSVMVDADIAEEMALKMKSAVKADAASMMMMQAQRLQRGTIEQLMG